MRFVLPFHCSGADTGAQASSFHGSGALWHRQASGTAEAQGWGPVAFATGLGIQSTQWACGVNSRLSPRHLSYHLSRAASQQLPTPELAADPSQKPGMLQSLLFLDALIAPKALPHCMGADRHALTCTGTSDAL